MIKIDGLRKLVNIILHSGYVVGEKPLSTMFIGNVGIGKSELLKHFQLCNNIIFLTDLTYMGVIGLLKDNKELRHLIIPDFLKLTMKKGSTVDNIISVLNSLIEEGLFKISLFGVSEDFKGKQVGLITATTISSYRQHYKKWNSMGFLSRMLEVSYDYTDKTINEIFEYIHKGKYIDEHLGKIELPIRNYDIKLKPSLSKKLREKKTSFRNLKILRTLVKANALMHDRGEVIQADITEIMQLSKFFNLKLTKI